MASVGNPLRDSGAPREPIDARTVRIGERSGVHALTDDDYEYDDSPWTMEEMHALAWEAGQRAGWDEMTEYDDLPQGA